MFVVGITHSLLLCGYFGSLGFDPCQLGNGTIVFVEIFWTGSYGDAQGCGRGSKVAAQEMPFS
jgi:hypothetical protein